MDRVERVAREVREFSSDEFANFRQWFAAFDAEAWDRQLEADVKAGKLDALAERALRDHATGKSTKL
ncbi:MAG: hypothetical protein ACHP78_02685 [Terriglobales bacterium]